MTPTKFFIGRAIGFLVILALVLAFFAYKNATAPEVPSVVVEDITGCYISTIQKDVYTLNIQSQEGENFSGTLQFKNFEKDSSSGTYTGTYVNQTLTGEYAFQSEGMDSVVTTKFKKFGNDFIRGVIEEDGGIMYDATIPGGLFVKGECL